MHGWNLPFLGEVCHESVLAKLYFDHAPHLIVHNGVKQERLVKNSIHHLRLDPILSEHHQGGAPADQRQNATLVLYGEGSHLGESGVKHLQVREVPCCSAEQLFDVFRVCYEVLEYSVQVGIHCGVLLCACK